MECVLIPFSRMSYCVSTLRSSELAVVSKLHDEGKKKKTFCELFKTVHKISRSLTDH